MKKRRGLIPADGFYEWRKQGKQKQSYYIRMRDDRLDPAKTPAELSYMFEPFLADVMVSYPVNPVVNGARHEGADCIDAIDSICG